MAESEITLSAVEYLNTKPFIEGLTHYSFDRHFNVALDSPAQCSQRLHAGTADIGIIPVADYPTLAGFRRITNWGIAADGPVRSVLLVANQPIAELDRVFLDYQSRTSNKLMQILADEYFRSSPEFILSGSGYECNLRDNEGAIIIGDRALKLASQYRYRYDLADAWKKMTGLPFVFAIWVASARISADLELEIDKALSLCMSNRSRVAEMYQPHFIGIDLHHYLTQCIQYRITARHLEGLELFWEKIQMLEGIC